MLALMAKVGSYVGEEKANSTSNKLLIMFALNSLNKFAPNMLALLARNSKLLDSKENTNTRQQRQHIFPNHLNFSLFDFYEYIIQSTILPTSGNKRQH